MQVRTRTNSYWGIIMTSKIVNDRIIVHCLIVSVMIFSIIPSLATGDGTLLNHSPFSEATIIKGDPLIISGNESGIPELRVWIFGPQYANFTPLLVHPDGRFEYLLTSDEIAGMKSGNFTVILQSPGDNRKYDISVNERTGEVINRSSKVTDPDRVIFTFAQAKNMLDDDAPNALVTALNNSAVDDHYSIYRFSIEDPFITLDPLKEFYHIGENISITGTTNVPAGEMIWITIRRWPHTVQPGEITEQEGRVIVGNGPGKTNVFFLDLDSSRSLPINYDIFVTCVNRTCEKQHSSFTLLERPAPTTVPASKEPPEISPSRPGTASPATITTKAAPFPAIVVIAVLIAGVIGGLFRRRY